MGIRTAIDHLQRERFARTYMGKPAAMNGVYAPMASPFGPVVGAPGLVGAPGAMVGAMPLGASPLVAGFPGFKAVKTETKKVLRH